MLHTQDHDIKSLLKECRHVFVYKLALYGKSWEALSYKSMTFQIYMKLYHVKHNYESSHEIKDELMGVINYCIITYMAHANKKDTKPTDGYDRVVDKVIKMFNEKDSYYVGSLWRGMPINTIIDFAHQKVMRLLSIGDCSWDGGLYKMYDNLIDLIIYCTFLLTIKQERP